MANGDRIRRRTRSGSVLRRRGWHALVLLTVVRLAWMPVHLAFEEHGEPDEALRAFAMGAVEAAGVVDDHDADHDEGHHSHSTLDHASDLLQWTPRDDSVPSTAIDSNHPLTLPPPAERFANLRAEPRAPDLRPPDPVWPRGPPSAA